MLSNSFSSMTAIVQGLSIALLVAIPALWIVALLKLRRISLPAQTKVLWAVIILLIPIIGALAFLIVNPSPQADKH